MNCRMIYNACSKVQQHTIHSHFCLRMLACCEIIRHLCPRGITGALLCVRMRNMNLTPKSLLWTDLHVKLEIQITRYNFAFRECYRIFTIDHSLADFQARYPHNKIIMVKIMMIVGCVTHPICLIPLSIPPLIISSDYPII